MRAGPRVRGTPSTFSTSGAVVIAHVDVIADVHGLEQRVPRRRHVAMNDSDRLLAARYESQAFGASSLAVSRVVSIPQLHRSRRRGTQGGGADDLVGREATLDHAVARDDVDQRLNVAWIGVLGSVARIAATVAARSRMDATSSTVSGMCELV